MHCPCIFICFLIFYIHIKAGDISVWIAHFGEKIWKQGAFQWSSEQNNMTWKEEWK